MEWDAHTLTHTLNGWLFEAETRSNRSHSHRYLATFYRLIERTPDSRIGRALFLLEMLVFLIGWQQCCRQLPQEVPIDEAKMFNFYADHVANICPFF